MTLSSCGTFSVVNVATLCQRVHLIVRVRNSGITSGTGKKTFCSFVAPMVVYNESCVDVLH